ncbi:hypothetical protein MKUB_55220 [Mycobacterium kubicae]|uniref:Protease inhibitor I42 family protein n=1 Tax=Mycobacterium kubicae TaxID=120959 RepID=A0AAX1J6P6_9MYCO|nr:protease inhibitor I42 family protein [Mycobacterium kubicae]MCV7094155.1 protease inhibitor I42 family protein [Mycobacterium kubicae]OBF21418.1 hypothetical protein A5725_01430 [Mycobacterium kubicae]OBK49824.1 hypothetical protein A5657_21400 [Mycobacterium kubicae]ORV98496.1 hypothetical protein AWC13_13700 [Mycobacterium kubicae]QNI07606.1 protease inhibitor I42 family protein [Mycobacterium kubicae]
MRLKLLVVTLAMLLAAVVGCSRGNVPSSKTIDVSIDEVMNQSAVTREETLLVGNTLRVSLGSNHTTPFRWTAEAKIGDPTILKQTSHEYQAPNTNRMGAPGNDVWTFVMLKPGTTTIVANYASIVGADTTPACTFTAKVTVR